jgi:hypothetical protein
VRHPYKPVAKFLEDLRSENWRTLSQQGQAVLFSIVGSARKSVDPLLSVRITVSAVFSCKDTREA